MVSGTKAFCAAGWITASQEGPHHNMHTMCITPLYRNDSMGFLCLLEKVLPALSGFIAEADPKLNSSIFKTHAFLPIQLIPL